MTNKRVGIFEIDRTFIDSSPTAVMEALSQVLIVRAEMMWHNDTIEYMAISDLFEENIKRGAIRRYTAKFGTKEIKDPDYEGVTKLELTFEGFE